MNLKSLFAVLLLVVAGNLYMMLRDDSAPALAEQGPSVPPAPLTQTESPVMPAPIVAQADNRSPAMNAAPGEPGNAIDIPPIQSESERADTREARVSALPVFLQAAEQRIAEVRQSLETARQRGASVEEISALESSLQTLQQVREKVLARNSDILAHASR